MTVQLMNFDAYEVTVLSDGTTTMAEVTVNGAWGVPMALGQGRARRRKGEPRKEAVGELLALTRAFEDAVRRMRSQLESMGYVE